MEYRSCKACGEIVAIKIRKCPHCGNDLDQQQPASTGDQDFLADIAEIEAEALTPSAEAFPGQPTDELTTYWIRKAGFIRKTYTISDINDYEFMLARRSAFNHLGPWLLIVISSSILVFVLFLGSISPWWSSIGYYLALLVFFAIMLVIIKISADIRRFTVQHIDGSSIGTIRGGFFFSRWKIADSVGKTNTILRFSIIGKKGEIEAPSGKFAVLRFFSGEEVDVKVYDSYDNLCFSVDCTDSRYKRENFEINSSGKLDPFLTCSASICIIERFFRPKSRTG